MTARIIEEGVGRAANAEAALSPSATAPVVAALPGNDQPRGHFWITEEADGANFIRGRNGRILYRYPAGQETIATSHLLRLQGRYGREIEALRDAAPDMYALIADIEETLTADNNYRLLREACRKILAKARGQ